MSERYALWPSALTFLYEGCRRCFYLDLVEDLERPDTPFPGVFGRIDEAMKAFFEGREVSQLLDWPPGRVRTPPDTLVSQPVEAGGVEVFVRGKVDALVAFEDGTFGVLDFKTTQPSEQTVDRYRRQLEAYALALENPADGPARRSPVTRLGLVCVEPVSMRAEDQAYVFETEPTFLPVDRDPEGFADLLDEVGEVLGRERPPMPAKGCEFCDYRQRAQETGL